MHGAASRGYGGGGAVHGGDEGARVAEVGMWGNHTQWHPITRFHATREEASKAFYHIKWRRAIEDEVSVMVCAHREEVLG